MKFVNATSKVLDFLFPLRKEVTRLRDEVLELRSTVDTELQEVQGMYRSGEIVTEEELQGALGDYCPLQEFTNLRKDVDNKWGSYEGEKYVDEQIEGCACAEEVEGISSTVDRLDNSLGEPALVKTLVEVLLQNLTDEGVCSVSHNGHKWIRS